MGTRPHTLPEQWKTEEIYWRKNQVFWSIKQGVGGIQNPEVPVRDQIMRFPIYT